MSIEIIDDEIKLYLNEGQPGALTEDGVQDVTNKTIALGSNTVTGTKAQFNTALTDGDFAFVGDVQPIDADLTAIAALAGTTGLLRKTAANTWSLDTTAFSTLAVGSTAGSALAASGAAGSASTAARSDHVHPFPTAANVGAVAATNGAASGLTLSDGYTEEVFAVSGTTPALSPASGSIQTWALTGNSTPTSGTWNAGQSITLMVDDGSGFTVNWSSLAVTWKSNGGVAPTLLTTGFTVIALWKVGTTIYGARVGDA